VLLGVKYETREMARAHSAPMTQFVIPAAFSPRESGEGIQRLYHERHWIPAFAGMTDG
jgi:hypothetical protein